MSPPCYADIGKSARDLIKKNFDLGVHFISFKGKNDPFEFTALMNNVLRAGKVVGLFESKYKAKDYGLTLTEKWYSKSYISAEATIEDKLIEGFKNSIKMTYDTNTGTNRTNMKSELKKDAFNGSIDFVFRKAVPNVTQSLVLGYQDYLLGADVHFDSAKQKIDQVDLACAYSAKDFGFHGIITHWAKTYTVGIYQRLTDRFEYAAEATWNRDVPDNNWAVVGQFAVDQDRKHMLKVRLDNLQRISVSLKSQIMEGVKTTFCAMFNDADDTQVGIGLEVER